MRVVVLGAGGQLGRELTGVLPALGHEAVALGRDQVDIGDERAVAAALELHRPDAVVNCAAYTRVDVAESDVERCTLINAEAPGWIARACAGAGVALLHMSTDFVFDGSATSPIDESAVPHPASVYGRTKLDGEQRVRSEHPQAQIVRTAWLFGQDGPNFVLTMLRLARERGALRVVADQRGSPTWTGHLAPALARLLERGVPGTYHLTNSGETSWHGLARATVAAAGLDVPVEAITTADYPTPARRPAYSVLDNRAWRELEEAPLPPWEAAVREYVGRLQPPCRER